MDVNKQSSQIRIEAGKVVFPSLIKDTHYIDVLIKEKTKEHTSPGILLKEEGIQVLENVRRSLFDKPVDLTVPLPGPFAINEIVGKTIGLPGNRAVEGYIEMLKKTKYASDHLVRKELNVHFPGIVVENKEDASSIMLHSWEDVSQHLNIERRVMEFYYPDMTPVKDQYGLPLEKLTYEKGDPLTIGPELDIHHRFLLH